MFTYIDFETYLERCDVEAYAKKYKVNPKQLKMGIKVEKEHDGPMGKDTDVVGSKEDIVKIAVAHLREDPKYYTKLKKVEGGN
jgi:hypothetical protein